MSGFVMVGHHQQHRVTPAFQKDLFQLGQLPGAVAPVDLDLSSDIAVQGIGCSLGRCLIGKRQQSQLLAGSPGGAEGACARELFPGQAGLLQSVECPDKVLFQRFQRFGKGFTLQQLTGQLRLEGGFLRLGGAGGQGQNCCQQQGYQSFHRAGPPVWVGGRGSQNPPCGV